MKITLLGDSIRLIGYGTKVPQLLGEDFEVFQPTDNCRYSKYTFRMIYEWQEEMKGSRIVHWNNGIWDACLIPDRKPFSTETEYVDTMLRIADILQKNHEKVIFATTTPVREDAPNDDTKIIKAYNEAIVPKLSERGIVINDLYSTVIQDVEKYIREDDKIHLTDAGIDVCAAQVAKVIKEIAKTL